MLFAGCELGKLLTSTLNRSVRLEDGVHLEPADAASVATFRLLGHLLALLGEEAALVHLGLCKKGRRKAENGENGLNSTVNSKFWGYKFFRMLSGSFAQLFLFYYVKPNAAFCRL